MPDATTRILFLCTGNSARSILAEAIACQRYGATIEAASAGSAPRGAPHPLALETLRRHGLHTEGLASDSWDRYRDDAFDLVITLCAAAAGEACPAFPGAPPTVHWGFPDPPAAADPAAAFERVFAGLDAALAAFTADGDGDPAVRAELVARTIVARVAVEP